MQKVQCFSNVTVVVVAFLLLVSSSMVSGEQYIVGDTGWGEEGVDYNDWVSSKTFYTGDVLIFHYDPQLHSVVVATNAGTYHHCVFQPNLGIYTTVNDELYLTDVGTYFFIREYQCDGSGMKMIVTVNN